jgi:Tfp pilus assembly protein PilO
MKIENRQKVLGFAAIAVLALLLGDKFIISPLAKSYKDRAARIEKCKKSVQQGTLLLAREQTIRSRWDYMRTNTLPLDTSLAEQKALGSFDRWAQESRMAISSIKPQWKRNNDGYETLECHVDATGNLATLTRFLYNIEKTSLALKVETLTVTSRDNNGQLLNLGVQLSGLQLSQMEKP